MTEIKNYSASRPYLTSAKTLRFIIYSQMQIVPACCANIQCYLYLLTKSKPLQVIIYRIKKRDWIINLTLPPQYMAGQYSSLGSFAVEILKLGPVGLGKKFINFDNFFLRIEISIIIAVANYLFIGNKNVQHFKKTPTDSQ